MLTGLDDFTVVRQQDSRVPGAGHMLECLQQHSIDRGDHMTYGLSAFAQPSGITLRSAYECLRNEMLDDLRNAQPVDIVILLLHGAMIAEGYDDCEGDIITRVRTLVGPEVFIGVELDLHCHLSPPMLNGADIIVTYKEYPHIDINDRAIELYELASQTSKGLIIPTMAIFDCKMIGLYPTTEPMMRGFVERMIAAEQQEAVLSVSFAHGFPWGDVPYTDGKILVVTDNNPTLAASLAQALGRQLFALRGEIGFNTLPMDKALSRALASKNTPVVVADQSDNPGAGAPSDATFVLRWLLDHGVESAAMAILYDPQAVRLAKTAGEGATLKLRLGGKLGPSSGDPLDLTVTVLCIKENHRNPQPQQQGDPLYYALGDTVALRCEGIDIIVSSRRGQCFTPDLFRNFGIDPEQKQLLIPKSMNHFYAAFAPMASEILYMAAPGAVTPVVENIDYQCMPIADKYPWVENPHRRSRSRCRD